MSAAISAFDSSLRDQRHDLGLPLGEALLAARPVEPDRAALLGSRADDDLAVVDPLERIDEVGGGQGLGEVARRPALQRGLHEVGVEAPRVHRDLGGVVVGDQHIEVGVVGLALGEGVVQRDVDIGAERLVGVELHDGDAVAVALEHVGHTDERRPRSRRRAASRTGAA